MLSAGQLALASFEVHSQFCPNLREDKKSHRNSYISSALAKISSWVQRRNQNKRPVLRQLYVMGRGGEFSSPRCLAECISAPAADTLPGRQHGHTWPQHHPSHQLSMDHAEGQKLPWFISKVFPHTCKRCFCCLSVFSEFFFLIYVVEEKHFFKLLNLRQDGFY